VRQFSYPALRFLPLPLSIALCLPVRAETNKLLDWRLCPATDVIPAFEQAPSTGSLPKLEDRSLAETQIEGDALLGTQTLPRYVGNVVLQRHDQFMSADSLRFNTESGDYLAEGNLRYSDDGIRLMAERAEGNQDADVHRITQIQYQLIDQRGNGVAQSLVLQGAQAQMRRSTYTTCDPSQPWWKLSAPYIHVDNDTGFGTARNAVVFLGNMPVLYSPWFRFPIDERRSSGLLFPKLRVSSRNGLDYAQPIYLNLAPNYDATISPHWMSRRGMALDNEFRYLYSSGRGKINGSIMPDDRLRDRQQRSHVTYRSWHNLNATWQARANLGWVSDERYIEDFSNRLEGLGSSSVQSTFGIYGSGRYWQAGIMADHWQLADYTLTEAALPYHRRPRVFFNWDQTLGQRFDIGLKAEAVQFTHDAIRGKNPLTFERTGVVTARPGGSRLDLKPHIAVPLTGASWYLTPALALRHTVWHLDEDLAKTQGSARTLQRTLPIASVDAGLLFDRNTTIRRQPFLHTLEPRLFYLHIPYRDHSGVPLFDTRSFPFSWGQLFRDTRFTGADRQNDSEQITTAVTTRLINQNTGRERLSASAGQIIYLRDSLVTLQPGNPITEKGKSAWVGDVTWSPTDRWTLGSTYQWNPDSRHEEMFNAYARYLSPVAGVVNLNYRYRRNPNDGSHLLRQADLSFFYPLNPRWSMVGRYYYSLLDERPLEIIGGTQWSSCCVNIRALVRRYVRTREGEMDNSIQLEFEFKGLGSAGQNTQRTFRRAVVGYHRDDLYLVPPESQELGDMELHHDPNQIP